jgi:hypothetical protein
VAVADCSHDVRRRVLLPPRVRAIGARSSRVFRNLSRSTLPKESRTSFQTVRTKDGGRPSFLAAHRTGEYFPTPLAVRRRPRRLHRLFR